MVFDHSIEQTVHAKFGPFGQRAYQVAAVNFEHAASNDLLQIVDDVVDFGSVLSYFLDVIVERVWFAEESIDLGISLECDEEHVSRGTHTRTRSSDLFGDEHGVLFECGGVLRRSFEFCLQHFSCALLVRLKDRGQNRRSQMVRFRRILNEFW